MNEILKLLVSAFSFLQISRIKLTWKKKKKSIIFLFVINFSGPAVSFWKNSRLVSADCFQRVIFVVIISIGQLFKRYCSDS